MNLKLSAIIRNFKSLFNDDLWTLDLSHSTSSWKRLVRFARIVRITLGTFAENRMGFQCVALSYFIALAIVPLFAFVFAVTGDLGLSDKIYSVLGTIFAGKADIINTLAEKSDNIISVAKSGWVGIISALAFLWTILWMMFQVERVFNNVWCIRRVPRKLYKRFSFYILLVILIPFVISAFGLGIAFYINLPKLIGWDLGHLRFIAKLLGWLIVYGITGLIFSAMYKFIPAADVKYKYALKAALVSAAVFIIFQYLYLRTQVFVSHLNGVYGALAAVPLFLIWLNFSWQIVIYGAELNYGFQNVENYE